MRKKLELTQVDSCLNKAADDELVFVLRTKDPCAPVAIRMWVEARILFGKNQRDDPKILEALECAAMMERERKAGEK